MRKIDHDAFDDTRNDILAEIHNRLAEISKFLEMLTAYEMRLSSSTLERTWQEIPRIEREFNYCNVTEDKNAQTL